MLPILVGETSQKRYPVASGLQTLWENRQMPLGLEEEGFILQCYATVIDDLGGSGTYFIQEVQVVIDKVCTGLKVLEI